MPERAKRPCASPSCAGFATTNGYCAKHQGKVKQKQQQYDKARGSAWAAGYDSDWQKLRDKHLDTEPLCRHCKKRGYVVPADEVDHIIPFKGKADPLRLDPDNLQSLCHSCHVTKTNQDKRTGLHKHSRATSIVHDYSFAVGDKVRFIREVTQSGLLTDSSVEWEVISIVDNMIEVTDGVWTHSYHFSNFVKAEAVRG